MYAGGIESDEVCIKAIVDFGNGVVGEKTILPSAWSKEKVAAVIHDAALPENRLDFLDEIRGKELYQCLDRDNNILIDILIDKHNVISTAYPSGEMFKEPAVKEFITMKRLNGWQQYQYVGKMDYRFSVLAFVCSDDFEQGCLLAWLNDKAKDSLTNELVSIEKHDDKIILFDRSDDLWKEEDWMGVGIIELNSAKSFTMSRKNFEEIVYLWENLRVSMPDIILVVIHEDNHVSLETDPVIIKEYQDAGYAFDCDRK